MADIPPDWSKQQTLLLFGELRKYPNLYKPTDSQFVNKSVRAASLYKILQEITKIKPNCTIKCIKRKIRTLQSQLCKEKTKIINSKKSGTSTDNVYIPKLWCYNELQFLVNVNDSEESLCNIDLSEIGIDYIEHAEETVEHKRRINKKRITNQLQDRAIEALEYAKEFMKQPPVVTKKDEFCRYLCSELKKIKLDDTFDQLKVQILQLEWKTIGEEKKNLQSQHDSTNFNRNSRPSSQMSNSYIQKYRNSTSTSSNCRSSTPTSASSIFDVQSDIEFIHTPPQSIHNFEEYLPPDAPPQLNENFEEYLPIDNLSPAEQYYINSPQVEKYQTTANNIEDNEASQQVIYETIDYETQLHTHLLNKNRPLIEILEIRTIKEATMPEKSARNKRDTLQLALEECDITF